MESVRINIAGDFCVKHLGNLSFGKALKQLLDDSDINVINLEGPILSDTPQPISKSGPCIYQDPKVPSFLERNGFNAIATANNHIMDYGKDSLLNTKKTFSKAKLFGSGNFTEAYRIEVFQIKNKRVGLLSLTQYEFGVLGYEDYNQDVIGAAWLCHPFVDELIINSKQQCDFLIVIPHAGLENYELPLPEIRSIYRHFINMGADAVIGGHPHIPQCNETFKGKPIVYSIGNFCFDSFNEENLFWNVGMIVSIVLQGNNAETIIRYVKFDKTKHEVNLSNDTGIESFIFNTNNIFCDNCKYIANINKKCLDLKCYYADLFELSGLYDINDKSIIRILYHHLKILLTNHRTSSTPLSQTHFINNLRCETHRWIISRIYELSLK